MSSKSRRWQSGQLQLAVNQSPYGLRGFKSLPAHKLKIPVRGFFVEAQKQGVSLAGGI